MSTTSWLPRPVPDLDDHVLRVWHWELRSSGQLTAARRSLREELLGGGTHEDDVGLLLLAFEELASNGLRHGRPPVSATVSATPTGWLIDVSDADGTRCPTPAVDRDPALGGLGLHLVMGLSSTHGWSVHSGRKHVWACVPRPSVA
jgi:anti-sigma regulatory factor (Ser/Thr protein kinase)